MPLDERQLARLRAALDAGPARTGWSTERLVRTARTYRTIQIRAGQHTLTAEDPLPPDLRDALALIRPESTSKPVTRLRKYR